MLPLAHLGIGSAIAHPISGKRHSWWLLLGTILPDIIDKPLFFLMGVYAHFDHGGWVPGKRGFAHTLVFLMMMAATARFRNSQAWKAVTFGVATHLVLDIFSKAFTPNGLEGSLSVLFWPFLGFSFPVLSYGIHGILALAFEIVGLMLLTIYIVGGRKKLGWPTLLKR